MTDFIETYSDVYPEGFCEHVIAEFERYAEQGAGASRQQSEGAKRHIKDDHHMFLNGRNLEFEPFGGMPVMDVFMSGLQKCFDQYADKYSAIADSSAWCRTMKIQRTREGGGYHVFHCEQGGGDMAGRVLVYMLYLNTLEDGQNGETEFLHQQRRISPESNTMVLWPAAFTHAHRGNPVYSGGEKYIVTGWFKYE